MKSLCDQKHGLLVLSNIHYGGSGWAKSLVIIHPLTALYCIPSLNVKILVTFNSLKCNWWWSKEHIKCNRTTDGWLNAQPNSIHKFGPEVNAIKMKTKPTLLYNVRSQYL